MDIHFPFPIILAFGFLILLLVPVHALLWIHRKQNQPRKSPLTTQMLRSPGESLAAKIEDLSVDILTHMLFIPILPLLLYASVVTMMITGKWHPGPTLLTFLGLIILASISYFSITAYRLMRKRNLYRLGLECEMAVGQELHNRIKDQFKIYHDFPAPNFNIDHIAIGSTGIFAIETKGRSKARKAESRNWELIYDEDKLIFPNRTERSPVEQAQRQAQWLARWIEQATGTRYPVYPVLAIPGWFIKRTKPNGIRVYNGKSSAFLARGQRALSDKDIQAISFQVAKQCRNIVPTSYRTEVS